MLAKRESQEVVEGSNLEDGKTTIAAPGISNFTRARREADVKETGDAR